LIARHTFENFGNLCPRVCLIPNKNNSPIIIIIIIIIIRQVSEFHIPGAFELGCLAIFVVGHQAGDVFLQADLPVYLKKKNEKSLAGWRVF